jgi:hypothetical protein
MMLLSFLRVGLGWYLSFDFFQLLLEVLEACDALFSPSGGLSLVRWAFYYCRTPPAGCPGSFQASFTAQSKPHRTMDRAKTCKFIKPAKFGNDLQRNEMLPERSWNKDGGMWWYGWSVSMLDKPTNFPESITKHC